MKNKGIYFALGAALISGFAVFLNKFATKAFGDPYIFTTIKNINVALILVCAILFPKFWKELKILNKKQWLYLSLIGIIGGSIPFLLFFKGLTMTSSVNAAFIHKTLFIWVSLLAFFILKEQIGRMQILAMGLLFGGNILLLGIKSWYFATGDFLILGAVFFWAIEYMFAKKLLVNISSEIVAWGRMFLGSLILIGFILATNRIENIMALEWEQLKWMSISAPLLFGFVFTWYKALKYAPASLVTCFLVPASLITTLLNSIFITHKYSLSQVCAFLFFTSALILFYKFHPKKHEKFVAETI